MLCVLYAVCAVGVCCCMCLLLPSHGLRLRLRVVQLEDDIFDAKDVAVDAPSDGGGGFVWGCARLDLWGERRSTPAAPVLQGGPPIAW